jgi:putative CocE/NonD family hydrolase
MKTDVEMQSWVSRLEDQLLNHPLVAEAYRRAFVLWMNLPGGAYKVALHTNQVVPAADGIKLATDHYEPQGAGKAPAILMRTPYSRGGSGSLVAALFARQFATHGYHVLCQDCRGRFGSEGEFVPFLHEAEDGKATLAWIAEQPWSDGTAAMWGASYLGYCQWAAAAAGSPQLKALAPLITSSNLMHFPVNGFPLDLLLRWMFQMATMDDPVLGVRERLRRINDAAVQDRLIGTAFWHLPMATADEVAIGRASRLYREMADSDPTHPHWIAADHSASAAAAPPADFTSGWYDLFLDGLLADFRAQQDAGRRPQLTVGPWNHLSLGYLPVAFNNGLAWFDVHLKGNTTRLRAKPVRLYVMGAGVWRDFDVWPPPSRELRLFLHGNGAAKTGRLRMEVPPPAMAPDRYRYDPADPTPNLGGPKMGTDAGAVDNRPLELRPDVLVFSTTPLAQDCTVIGPVQAELYVRSSLANTDFFVRLCDVDRNGCSLNVCDGNLRMAPGQGDMQPDGSLRIKVAMSATAYCFRAGHRIRVQVSSGAHPRFARNLGIPEPQVNSTMMVAADQTLYHDAAHPSAIALPFLPQ